MVINKTLKIRQKDSAINVLEGIVSKLPLFTPSTIYKNLAIKISNENFRPILIIIISLIVFITFSLLYLDYFLSADMFDLRKDIVDLEFMYNEVLKKNSGLEQKNILLQQLLKESNINKEIHIIRACIIALVGAGLGFGCMYLGYSMFASKLIIPAVCNLVNSFNEILFNISNTLGFNFESRQFSMLDEKDVEYVVIISRNTVDIFIKLSENHLVTISQYLDYLEKLVLTVDPLITAETLKVMSQGII